MYGDWLKDMPIVVKGKDNDKKVTNMLMNKPN